MSQYADRTDLAKWGLRADVLAGFTEAEQDAHLQAASELFESYVKDRGYPLPLTTWGNDLRMSVVRVAAWTLLNFRGASPSNPASEGVAKGHDDAIAWWRDIGKGIANLNVGTTPVKRRHAVPQVISDSYENGEKTRGW